MTEARNPFDKYAHTGTPFGVSPVIKSGLDFLLSLPDPSASSEANPVAENVETGDIQT